MSYMQQARQHAGARVPPLPTCPKARDREIKRLLKMPTSMWHRIQAI